MKSWLLSTAVLVITAMLIFGCSDSINNSISFQNMSAGDVYINFRGSVITVAAGQTSVVKNIPKGIYDYSTTYSVPASVSGSSSQGNMTGTLTINAGTKIQFLYSSTLFDGTYTIFVTISDSDDQTKTTSKVMPLQNGQKSTLTGP